MVQHSHCDEDGDDYRHHHNDISIKIIITFKMMAIRIMMILGIIKTIPTRIHTLIHAYSDAYIHTYNTIQSPTELIQIAT